MTRPIEFRLLNEHKEIVGYEKWNPGNFNMETKKDYYVNNPCWLYSNDQIRWDPLIILHRYKNQFTGLLDRNGKSIFEGDIVEVNFSTFNGDVLERGTIVFYDGCFIMDGINDSYALFIDRPPEDTEVIGNIYENGDLLI
jgi:hypothetical protein